MLIWVLQSSQCSKIWVAQHWGRRGGRLNEDKSVKSECKKFSRKFKINRLFHRFVTSDVVSDHALFSGKISWLTGSTHKGTRKRSCKRTWQRNTSEKQTTSKNKRVWTRDSASLDHQNSPGKVLLLTGRRKLKAEEVARVGKQKPRRRHTI